VFTYQYNLCLSLYYGSSSILNISIFKDNQNWLLVFKNSTKKCFVTVWSNGRNVLVRWKKNLDHCEVDRKWKCADMDVLYTAGNSCGTSEGNQLKSVLTFQKWALVSIYRTTRRNISGDSHIHANYEVLTTQFFLFFLSLSLKFRIFLSCFKMCSACVFLLVGNTKCRNHTEQQHEIIVLYVLIIVFSCRGVSIITQFLSILNYVMNIITFKRDYISGSHGDEYENDRLLECCAL
jgi:hypothetical protein